MASKGAKRRQKLFDDYSKRFAATGGPADSFQCPICLSIFDKQDLVGTSPRLTLAHVIPESLGGRFCTLACASCNNDVGSTLEAFLSERFRAEDVMNGLGKLGGRLEGAFGSVGVEIQVEAPDAPWTLLVIEEQTNPAVLANLQSSLGSDAEKVVAHLTPRFRDRPSRVSAALYQSAYLLMFAYFGYDVVSDARFQKVREQILKPDEPILPAEFDLPPEAWANVELPDDHALMIVKQPELCVMPVLRFRPAGGRVRVIGVPLPGLDSETWPKPGMRDKVQGVIVRFRVGNDNGIRLRLRDVWDHALRMP